MCGGIICVRASEKLLSVLTKEIADDGKSLANDRHSRDLTASHLC